MGYLIRNWNVAVDPIDFNCIWRDAYHDQQGLRLCDVQHLQGVEALRRSDAARHRPARRPRPDSRRRLVRGLCRQPACEPAQPDESDRRGLVGVLRRRWAGRAAKSDTDGDHRDGRADPRANGVRGAEYLTLAPAAATNPSAPITPSPLPRRPRRDPRAWRHGVVLGAFGPERRARSYARRPGSARTPPMLPARRSARTTTTRRGHRPDPGQHRGHRVECREPHMGVAAIAATNIPTLSEWGMLMMAALLGLAGVWALRRRKDRIG